MIQTVISVFNSNEESCMEIVASYVPSKVLQVCLQMCVYSLIMHVLL